MLGGPNIIHLTTMTARIVVFYYKDGENKSVRQICETEMVLFVDILCNLGPRVDVLCIVSKTTFTR